MILALIRIELRPATIVGEINVLQSNRDFKEMAEKAKMIFRSFCEKVRY